MDDGTRAEAERLYRLWDVALGHDTADAVVDETEISRAIAAVHAADDAPLPDARFLARLRSDLIASSPPSAALKAARADSLALVYPMPAILPRRPILRVAIAAIAAALLVAALSGGGRWLSGSAPAPMVASAMASSVPLVVTSIPTATVAASNETAPGAAISPLGTSGSH